MSGAEPIPPRYGEGDRAATPRGGGVLNASATARQIAKRERRSGNLPEVLVWRELRKRPGDHKFRRQHPLSELILDFVCLDRRLAIEIDGQSHDHGDRPVRDEHRDAYLQSRGFAVLRIPAREVLRDLDNIIRGIVHACDERQPLHHDATRRGPPPRAGEVLEPA
ncbi:endonuclease domain-containing protein [Sphingomonas antarctica]|uniref:endonuclease domain-containing protein n=1 Tax=Sphingomonas antarctica TaxID=2040274 RepID=UPI0039ED54D8